MSEEQSRNLKDAFEKKLELKTEELEKLGANVDSAEEYKAVYDARMSENRQEIDERAKLLSENITDTVKALNSEMEKKRESDFSILDKYCEETKSQQTKYEKQIKYFKQVFDNLPDDNDIVEQFLKDSLPKLEAMPISARKEFPKPLKLDTNSAKEIKECFGRVEEDAYFTASGEEKPKYRTELEVEARFKPERDRSSIFGINVRPDGKAWITTFNYKIYLVLRTGHIYDEYRVSFLPIYTTVNKYGQLYVSSAERVIHRVTKDYDVTEFLNLAPFQTYGIHVTEEEKMLICLQGPKQESKIAIYSEMGMPLQEIKLGEDREPIFKAPKFVTQNARGEIFVADDRKLIVVQPSGKKYIRFQPEDATWEGKSLILDKFGNLISTEFPKQGREQSIHVLSPQGESVKTFKLNGVKVIGLNALCIDYQYEEPVLWIGSPMGDVFIAKFVNTA